MDSLSDTFRLIYVDKPGEGRWTALTQVLCRCAASLKMQENCRAIGLKHYALIG